MVANQPLALIVDDEPDLLELLELTLERMGVRSIACHSIAQAREALLQHAFHLCFTDMRLPDGDGVELVKMLSEDHPALPVAVITAYGSAETAVTALKAGAFDFVGKPVDVQHLRSMVRHALNLSASNEVSTADTQPHPEADARSERAREVLRGESEPMRAVRRMILKVARSQAPVYISGESGVGKELAARLTHELGPRADGPFVAINCGAVPHDLMESEFFGHRKGAFTGATQDREGLFRAAEGGTLFLDEVADLPQHVQVKLLRVLQEKVVRPVGESTETAVDVRVVSASHKDLAVETKEGRFRQDLFYRINVIPVVMPPLRERKEDIVPLAVFLLGKIAKRWELGRCELGDDARRALENHLFPGNVRELENILERAVAMAEGGEVRAAHLDLNSAGLEQHVPTGHVEWDGGIDLDTWLEGLETSAIEQALSRTNHNKTRAAELLGVSFRSLRYKIKKLGLED